MKIIDKFLAGYYREGSFLDATQRFLINQKKRGVSPATLSHLYYTLRPMGEGLSNPQMSSINPHEVKQYIEKLWLSYASATIRGHVGDIRWFFRWAKKQKLVGKNLGKRLVKPKVRPGKTKAANEQAVLAVAKFLAGKLKRVCYRDLFGNLQIGKNDWTFEELKACRDLFALVFLYETGCRAKELCNLSVKAMKEAVFANGAGGAFEVVSIGKTNDRSLRFTKATAEIFRIWNDVRPGFSLYVVPSWNKGEIALRPMTTRGLAAVFERRCQQAGVGEIFRPHSLRHAKVSRARKSVGLDLAKELLDHSTIVSTQNYADVRGGELSEAAVATGWKLGDIWH